MRTFLVAVVHGLSLVAQDPPVAVPLFDGESLAGWRGDPRVWRVEQGAIVGSTGGVELAANTFLISEREFGDFDLRLEIRSEGETNSGVQYRSRALAGDGFGVAGYQCDWHPTPNYTAMLYDEQGFGIVARRGQCVRCTDAGVEELGRLAKVPAIDLAQWHRLRIVARGDLVWHELDGRVVTAVQDRRRMAPRQGVIALQLHAGAPMTVWFRGLELVPAASDANAPVPDAVEALLRRADLAAARPNGAAPRWVWDAEAEDGEEVFFRRAFALERVPAAATLAVACDNHCRVYVNGERVLTDDSWESPVSVDVAKHLVAGANVVAVHGWNDTGPAALAVRLAWRDGARERELVTDADWRCSADDPDGWDRPAFADAGWAKVKVLAALGQADAPWSSAVGADALGTPADPYEPQVAVVDTALDGPGTEPGPVLRLLDVPRELGSWVSLCADDRGRLYAGAQGGGLYRIEPARRAGELTRIERMPVELGGAHGLLWWRNTLYAVVNGKESGLYRAYDTNGDDVLDRVERMRELDGRGEHGPHSVVVAPDGEHLLVLCGNQTKLPRLAASRVPGNWAEDRLVPRLDEPHPYWEGHSPPGGFVCQVDVSGEHWELLCCGFRNPYDLVALPGGRIVVYDADMEWDMGLPWYRPTRLLEARSGVDYGWRIGSAKWPADYPDAPPALCDIGPGSPVGMASVGEYWGNTVLLLDWTFGTVYAGGVPSGFAPERSGARAVVEVAPIVTGAPWPVTDVAVAPEGTYVVTGGRGLGSSLLRLPIRRSGDDGPCVGRPRPLPDPWQDLQRRSTREVLDEVALTDPVGARIALEQRPVATWRALALADDPGPPRRALTGWLALARQGAPADLGPLLDALGGLSFAALAHADRIAWLRVHALALLRLGPADDAQRALVARRLLPLFPTGDEREDQDLCELLAYVDAPGLLDVAVPRLAELRPSPPPPWAEVAARNRTYGPVIEKMLANMPPIGQIALADALRTVAHGWTLAQRRTYFAFLGAARQRSGGSSYDGYLQKILDAAWATCTPAEQEALADVVGKARADAPKFAATPPQGPGRDWQLGDIDELVRSDLAGRGVDAGRNLFHAVDCASCHYFAGEGGSGGPDLTSLGNKFTARDVLEAILAPSQVISDQYRGQVLTRKDGTALFGVVQRRYDGDVEIYEVVPAVADSAPVRVPVADVAKLEPSPLSPMPTDLLDRLSADEVRDLLAFLLSRGRR